MYLSLIPCHPDEEQFSGNKIKLEPDKVDYDNMTVDNYQNHDASQKLSFIESESNLPAREMLLKDKVHKNPKDVQAYLELIDIQVS